MFHNSSPLVVGGLFFIKKRKIMQIFPESVTKLWNEWELRVLVIFSLILQILLILMAKSRKYSAAIWIRIILWIAYLSADWVATVSLGVLSNMSGDLKGHSADADYVISAFWAPFLLLHLGGPDTITAYSLEDNELWLRHLLGFAVQVGVAFYVFLRAWVSTTLNFLTIPIFIAGIIKFGERVWVLRYTSSEHFRSSILPNSDPGPNYARFMEEYSSKKAEGFKVSSGTLIEARTEGDISHTAASNETTEAFILEKASYFFQTFMLLCVDLILSFHDVVNSRSFFQNITYEKAFEVIEVELGFMYDMFYTKAVVVFSFVSGFLSRFSLCCISLRCISFFSIISAFVGFLITEKQAYSTVDVIVTYVLLAGAIVLELYAVILLLCSDWTLVWLNKHKNRVVEHLERAILSIPLTKKKKWSNTMAQYSLIGFCLKDKPAKCSFIQKGLCIYKLLEKHRYKYSEKVTPDLKRLIFDQSLEKSKSASDFKACKELCACRGYRVLKLPEFCLHQMSKENIKILEESVQVEFDQSILLWHIATDLCYHSDQGENSNSVIGKHPKAGKLLSDYILYLLVMCPFMLPNGIGLIRFRDTCAEAIEFFEEKKSISNVKDACTTLLKVSTEIPPSEVKGDRSKSVLFDACRLAKCLQSLETEERWEKDKKWYLMSHVWVEMLSYAASQCRWNLHGQQLRRGGELLTHVWLLLAHLGITEQFQISQGYARAKLVVE
ncbi:hypothetical protein CMV_022706 [Castanea mollissima]|uniref:DUF4220 domain-containing protein n=1 Tax=Castanea mollissima TaxID=60419 RepID=A0A8J4QQT7_9ROSI|nr:hypothetical protein CMV_022706 [Castanea mollissima]